MLNKSINFFLRYDNNFNCICKIDIDQYENFATRIKKDKNIFKNAADKEAISFIRQQINLNHKTDLVITGQIDGDKDDKISLAYQIKDTIEEIEDYYFLSNFIVIADPIKSKIYERYTFASPLSSAHNDDIVPLENDQLYSDCKSFTNLIKDIYFNITRNEEISEFKKNANVKKETFDSEIYRQYHIIKYIP